MEEINKMIRIGVCHEHGFNEQFFPQNGNSIPISQENGFPETPEDMLKISLSMEEFGKIANLIEEIQSRLEELRKAAHIVTTDELPF